jgi:hypothetical protein
MKSYRKPSVVLQYHENFRNKSTSYENLVLSENARVVEISSDIEMDDYILRKVYYTIYVDATMHIIPDIRSTY